MGNLKDYLHYIIHILLLAVIILLIFVKPCVNVNTNNIENKGTPDIDTVYIDSTIYVTVEIPKPVTRYVTKYDTVVEKDIIYIDTSEYTANYYEDSIDVDYGKITWYAATEGRLLALDAEYKGITRKVIEYRTEKEQIYKTGLYVTSGIGYNFTNNATADIGLSIITKKGKIFGYEYDFINRFHKIKTGLRLF